MRLTAQAAKEVCLRAASRGLVVSRIEGGIWQNPGFMSRLDCIWDGKAPPITAEDAHKSNLRAADYIEAESGVHDVFILTAPSIAGWNF